MLKYSSHHSPSDAGRGGNLSRGSIYAGIFSEAVIPYQRHRRILPLLQLGCLRYLKAMSSVRNPQEKKQLSYERDHYNRNGESNKSWRKTKPKKKRKARKSFRKASNDLVKIVAGEVTSLNAVKKLGSVSQRKVTDWGAIHLREFVENRKEMRQARIDSRKHPPS